MLRRVLGLTALVGSMALTACSSVEPEEVERLERENLELIAERDSQRQQYADAMSRLEASNKQAQLSARELANARQQLDQAVDVAKKYEDQYSKALDELETLRKDASSTETAGLSTNQALIDRAAASLRGQPGVGNVDFDEDGNLEIQLESDVTFGSGKAKLTTAGRRSVQALRPVLTGKFAGFQLRIIGHTDNEPLKKTKHLYGDNRGLGSARALSVARFMETQMGIAADRIASSSRGELDPIASNKTSSGRAKNRRVEIVVILPPDEAASMARAK